MNEINFTIINHIAREKLGISWMEYGLADLIYNLSANNHGDYPGWCYASKETLSEMLGISKREIYRMITLLEEKHLLERHMQTKHLRTTLDWYNNVIIKQSAKMAQPMPNLHTSSAKMAHEDSAKMAHNNDIYNNDNNKETLSSKFGSLESITETEIQEIATKYSVPTAFVKSKYEDLVNYCGRKGKKYKNYHLALMDFVKKDSLKIRKEANGRSKITIIAPDPSWQR